MRRLFAFTHRSSLSAWRRAELLGLVATIPAFYLAMLAMPRAGVAALYGLASAAATLVVWNESRHSWAQTPARVLVARHQLGLLTAGAMLLSAALPVGDHTDVLGVRLATALLVVLRAGESLRPWFWRGGLPQLLTLALGVLGLCGLGFWWLEPRVHSFGEGLWLAFTTAATVGYGDIVPSTAAAKIFAVFVVLLGFAVLSLVTASIAAMWVQTEERRIEREILHDLHRELQEIRAELAVIRAEAGTGNTAGAATGTVNDRSPGSTDGNRG